MNYTNQTKQKNAFDFKHFFQLKIYRYTLLKMLKSVSTYVLMSVTFVIILGATVIVSLDNMSGTADDMQLPYSMYSWLLFFLYFSLAAIFWGFKSVQVIRDEISDGTLLIFSSMPFSRIRLVIEKWLALQTVSWIYIAITLLIPSLISLPISPEFGKKVFANLGYIVLAVFIIQLFFTTFGVFLSIFVGSKGVIGFSVLLGMLSVIGAMVPFFTNVKNIDATKNKSYGFIRSSSFAETNYDFMKKMNTEKETFLALTDPKGWPLWSFRDNELQISEDINTSFRPNSRPDGVLVPSQLSDLSKQFKSYLDKYSNKNNKNNEDYEVDHNIEKEISEILDDFINEPSNQNDYPLLYEFLTDKKVRLNNFQFGYNKYEFLEYSRRNTYTITFENNANSGSNLIQEWYKSNKINSYSELQPEKPNYSQIEKLDHNIDPLINKINNIYNKLIDMKVIGLNSSYQFRKDNKLRMYKKNNDSFSSYIVRTLFGNLIESLGEDDNHYLIALKERFESSGSDFEKAFENKLPNLLKKSPEEIKNVLYHSDQFDEGVYQFIGFLNDFAQKRFSGSRPRGFIYQPTTYNDESEIDDLLKQIKSEINSFKLAAYLNIWQQWLIMWQGDNITREGGDSLIYPINGYIVPEKSSIEYSITNNGSVKKLKQYYLTANPTEFKKIISLTGLYIAYFVVVSGLAILTLWRITRKDFV